MSNTKPEILREKPEVNPTTVKNGSNEWEFDGMNSFARWRSTESPSETPFNNLIPVSEGHSAAGYRAKEFIPSASRKFIPSPLERTVGACKIYFRSFYSFLVLLSVFLCVLCGSKSESQTKPANAVRPPVFTFQWKEEFTDLPRRIGVGDVTGDGTVRLVMLNEKPDNPKNSVLVIRKWNGRTFVTEFTAETQSAPDKLEVGKFAGAKKPAVILTADSCWAWNGKTFARRPAAKLMNLFGVTRAKNGEERVLIAASPTDIKAYKVLLDGAGDFLYDPIESPNSKAVSWGDMHATADFLGEMNFPALLADGGLVGVWDARRNNKTLLYYSRVEGDFDLKSEKNKPKFTLKKQTYYLALNDPNAGLGSTLWLSPALPAPLLDVQIADAKPGNAAGFLMLMGEPGHNKRRLLAFAALQE